VQATLKLREKLQKKTKEKNKIEQLLKLINIEKTKITKEIEGKFNKLESREKQINNFKNQIIKIIDTDENL
jgi:hypothetical protein